MQDKNYEFLKSQLLHSGFGDQHDAALKKEMSALQPEFILTHKANFGKDEAVATLHFRKSETTDMYFFNKFKMLLKKDGEDNILQQLFYLRMKEDNVTFKEAVNLLQGRSVFKEKQNKQGEKYVTWVKLDFSNSEKDGNFKFKSQSYGYELPKAMDKYNFDELKDPDVRMQIQRSLERGNRLEVNLSENGQQRKLFIEANPASGINNSLKIFDQNLQRVQHLSTKESETISPRKQQRNEMKEAEVEKKEGRKRGRGVT